MAHNTTELWMTKYIIVEICSSGGATLYKNPSDQTVSLQCEHFFLPLTLKSRSLVELPLDDFPSADGGFLGGT